MHLFRILLCLASSSLLSLSQTRIPLLPPITGTAVDPAADLLWLNDTSAGASGSKKITLAELVNVSSFTNGNFLSANAVEFSQVNGLTAALDGKMANTNAAILPAISANPAAVRAAAESAQVGPLRNQPQRMLVHDNGSGTPTTLADNQARACLPGPGTLTAWNIRDNSLMRYEGGSILLAEMSTSGNGCAAAYGAVTAAAGLTIQTRVTHGVMRQTAFTGFFTGFSISTNGGYGHGTIAIQPTAGWPGVSVNITRANSYISGATPPTENLPDEVGLSELYPAQGLVVHGEEVVLCVHYKTLTHQQYFIQGGRVASLGCEVGSDNWWLVGETYMDLTGLTLYPYFAWQGPGTHRVHSVKVMSSWAPGNRSICFEQHREKRGIHVPYAQEDPETGLLAVVWNSGWAHYGASAYIDIKYAVRKTDGSWTQGTLLPWPNSGQLGNQFCHLSVVNGKLWMVYVPIDWAATAIEGGVMHRREVTINPTTGVATVGPAVSLGFGTRAMSFSEIVETSTGRLIMPYQEDNGSGLVTPRVAYSDNDGATWTTVAIGTGTNPDSLTYLAEATITKEAGGALGCYMRANSKAYYSRSTDNGASWAQPAGRLDFPMPAANGTRLNARNLPGGGALLVGSDHGLQRRNINLWHVDENGTVISQRPIFDAMDPDSDTSDASTARSTQYPNVCLTSDGDIALVYSHQQTNTPNSNFSMSVRCNIYRDFLNPLPPEVTGAGATFKRGFRELRPIPRPPKALTYAATMTPDLSLGSTQYVTLTGTPATGIAAPVNMLPWEELTLIFMQPTSGGTYNYTTPINPIFDFGIITQTWKTGSGASNAMQAIYNPITNKWLVTSWN